jgi:hypothetical protein
MGEDVGQRATAEVVAQGCLGEAGERLGRFRRGDVQPEMCGLLGRLSHVDAQIARPETVPKHRLRVDLLRADYRLRQTLPRHPAEPAEIAADRMRQRELRRRRADAEDVDVVGRLPEKMLRLMQGK